MGLAAANAPLGDAKRCLQIWLRSPKKTDL